MNRCERWWLTVDPGSADWLGSGPGTAGGTLTRSETEEPEAISEQPARARLTRTHLHPSFAYVLRIMTLSPVRGTLAGNGFLSSQRLEFRTQSGLAGFFTGGAAGAVRAASVLLARLMRRDDMEMHWTMPRGRKRSKLVDRSGAKKEASLKNNSPSLLKSACNWWEKMHLVDEMHKSVRIALGETGTCSLTLGRWTLASLLFLFFFWLHLSLFFSL